MKHRTKIPLNTISERDLEEDETHLLKVKKKEKILSIGIYLLIILLTAVLMLILFNVVEF